MGATQRRLYDFLMERQLSGRRFTVDEAVKATGYAESSLKTNLSKHLRDVWVTRLDDKYFNVHDFRDVSFAVFADAMSQNTRQAFEDEEEWREQVKRLLSLGIQHRYAVRDAVDEIVRQLTSKTR